MNTKNRSKVNMNWFKLIGLGLIAIISGCQQPQETSSEIVDTPQLNETRVDSTQSIATWILKDSTKTYDGTIPLSGTIHYDSLSPALLSLNLKVDQLEIMTDKSDSDQIQGFISGPKVLSAGTYPIIQIEVTHFSELEADSISISGNVTFQNQQITFDTIGVLNQKATKKLVFPLSIQLGSVNDSLFQSPNAKLQMMLHLLGQ